MLHVNHGAKEARWVYGIKAGHLLDIARHGAPRLRALLSRCPQNQVGNVYISDEKGFSLSCSLTMRES